MILTQLPATLPLAGKPRFWVPSGGSRLSVPASVSSMMSTWWGLPLPRMKMREGDRSWVPPASSAISPCHHPCTHLEDMGHPMSARYSTVIPYRFGIVFSPLADFSPLFYSTWKTSHWCPVAEDSPSWTGRASAPSIPSTLTRPCWWVSMVPAASQVGSHLWDGVEGEGGGSSPRLSPHCVPGQMGSSMLAP